MDEENISLNKIMTFPFYKITSLYDILILGGGILKVLSPVEGNGNIEYVHPSSTIAQSLWGLF